jgi:hypothetical protein
VAEGEGFEPPDLSVAHFQDECIKPLCHPSTGSISNGHTSRRLPLSSLISVEQERIAYCLAAKWTVEAEEQARVYACYGRSLAPLAGTEAPVST